MSAANRGTQRNEADYYVTPAWIIREMFQTFQKLEPTFDFTTAKILDPCAGGDTTHPMAYPTVLKELGANFVDTVDIRQDSLASEKKDYLNSPRTSSYDAIYTNPPYTCAKEFVLAGLEDVVEGGFVGMLVRLNMFGAQNRRVFWQQHMPKHTIVHSRRPNFYTEQQKAQRKKDGKSSGSDATEYCHMIWQKGYQSPYTQLIVV